MKLLIKNGRVIDPSQSLDETLDLLIVEGKIAELSERYTGEVDEELDANGLVVAPGLIDIHVHLREPGYEYKETVLTGCRSAVAGGFTAVACMPNTDPPNDSPSVTRHILDLARDAQLAKVYPVAAATKELKGEELTEMGLLKDAGAVAFSDDGRPIFNGQVMRRSLEYSRALQMPVVQHAEDLEIAAGGQMNEGVVSARLGLAGHPGTAESAMVFRDISLARLTGGHLHVAHVSTKESLWAIEWAKSKKVKVTTEVTPHHLLLTDEDVGNYNTQAKMKPPLRAREDQTALVEALKSGLIDCIASDHAPHHVDEKDCPFADAAFGIVGLETTLPLIIEKFVKPGTLTLARAVDLLSTRPAKIFGLPGGTLAKGSPADVTIFSTKDVRAINPDHFLSRGRNTPFKGWKVSCAVIATLVNGRVVYRDGALA